MASCVLESAKYIADNSDYVHVNDAGCNQVAQSIFLKLTQTPYTTESWCSHPLTPSEKTRSTVDWIFTVDLLNFSFWSKVDDLDTGDAKSQRFAVNYKGELYTGYWSLVAAVNRALDKGIPFTSPKFWRDDLSLDTLKEIFTSATAEQIPLINERLQVLKEAGTAFKELGMNSFAEIVDTSDRSALKLVDTVRQHFSSFNDTANYKGKEIYVLKRAQILVADIWACFNGKDYGEFSDIDCLTMFADYRVPQILQFLGCLDYRQSLQKDLCNYVLIPNGDPREVELRGCSIWAVERIKHHIVKAHPEAKINSVLLDFYLWDSAKKLQRTEGKAVGLPTHRTRSVFY